MSTLRTRFVSLAVLLTSLFAGNLMAQEVGTIQQLRGWAAEIVRGDAENTSTTRLDSVVAEPPNSLTEQFLDKGQGFLVQVGALVEQRIGWLRPTSVKEQALIWMAVAMALPWGFVGWLRPILRTGLWIIRWLVVASWTGIALWSAWRTWGVASGADRFASTMLLGVPLLLTYFHSVARSVGAPADAGNCPE